MKKIIGLLVIGFLFVSCKVLLSSNEPVSKVVKVTGINQNELYVRSNNWMVNIFKNAKSVIQFTDKESGVITGKYLLAQVSQSSQYAAAQYVYAVINIQVKDGAAKITVTPGAFNYIKGNPYSIYSPEQAKIDVDKLITEFEIYIVKKVDKNW